MNPIAILSLGGTDAFAPNADDGTMYGKPATANALPQELFKNCRRFMLLDFTNTPLRSRLYEGLKRQNNVVALVRSIFPDSLRTPLSRARPYVP